MSASVLVSISSQAFATTPISGGSGGGYVLTLDGEPSRQGGGYGSGSPYSGGGGSASGTLNNTAGDFVSASAGGFSTFPNADSGTATINWGWSWDSTLPFSASTGTYFVPNWTYTFIASGNGVFNIGGTVTTSGNDLAGLNPLSIGGDGSGSIGGDSSDPSGSDFFSFGLLTGQQYTFSLSNSGFISGASGSGAGSAIANISWDISYVPEPVTWAMMLLGFGMIGGAMRSRNRKQLGVRFAR
ncbi:MAG: PEPxxWA-CTERM sorting domain-containing protein [Novosphingobium sp.]